MDEAEDRLHQRFGRQGRKKNTQEKQQKEKRILKNEESLRNILYNMKHNNICIMEIAEGKQSKQRIENLLEKMMNENFPNMVKEKDTSPRSSESTKHVGPKEAYIETHRN